MPVVDYVYRVHGDCVRAGYAYPLLGALKLNDPDLAQDGRVFFGSLFGVRPIGQGYLGIRETTHWRARGPTELKGRFHRLCGRKLLIGDHVIRLGGLRIEPLRPSTDLYAEFIAIKSMHFQKSDRHPTHREFLGWVSDRLARTFKVAGCKVQIGRRRKLHIGQYPASTGYALGVLGVDREASLKMQRDGLGGRRHMGGAMFLPGRLPRWAEGDDSALFDVSKSNGNGNGQHRVYRSEELQHPSTGMHFVFRVEQFMKAVRRGAHPNASWAAERFDISVQTARRFIRSIRDDVGAPIVYSDADRGWELTDQRWEFRL